MDQVALGKNTVTGDSPGAVPNLKTGGDHGALSRYGSGPAHRLVQEILKFKTDLFIPGGINISQVIGDDINIHLLGVHP